MVGDSVLLKATSVEVIDSKGRRFSKWRINLRDGDKYGWFIVCREEDQAEEIVSGNGTEAKETQDSGCSERTTTFHSQSPCEF